MTSRIPSYVIFCKGLQSQCRIHKKLSEFVIEEKNFLVATSFLVKPVSSSGPNSTFLNKEDLVLFLELASKCPAKNQLVIEAVACFYQTNVFTAEIPHIKENVSGVKLMEALKKKMPGMMPFLAQERKYRKASTFAFRATLLLRKCETDHYVDPRRLLDVLLHKFHFVEDTMNLRTSSGKW